MTLLRGAGDDLPLEEWLADRIWPLERALVSDAFVHDGTIRLVLYDDREASPTRKRLAVLHLSRLRPTLVTVPPGVWHGLENLEVAQSSSFVNFQDRNYRYESPDEWRLPWDSDEIPYRFRAAPT